MIAFMRQALFAYLLTTIIPVPDAYAYLDLGTGSYLLQVLVAGFFGALYVVKQQWFRVQAFFRRGSIDENASAEDYSTEAE